MCISDENLHNEVNGTLVWHYCSVAGLVFDVDPHGTDLPTYISYKIRIDTDHVDTTTGKKVTDQ